MRIAIGSDHGGLSLKEELKKELVKLGHDFVDMGTNGTESVDYPDYASRVAMEVVSGACPRGILVCGTGIGMCIAANKVDGVRAALVHDLTTARLAAQHNDANVLCLGGRLLAAELAGEIVATWLGTRFEERHRPRLDKIHRLEK
jgi:ribose 5-phosphate isomerase B